MTKIISFIIRKRNNSINLKSKGDLNIGLLFVVYSLVWAAHHNLLLLCLDIVINQIMWHVGRYKIPTVTGDFFGNAEIHPVSHLYDHFFSLKWVWLMLSWCLVIRLNMVCDSFCVHILSHSDCLIIDTIVFIFVNDVCRSHEIIYSRQSPVICFFGNLLWWICISKNW